MYRDSEENRHLFRNRSCILEIEMLFKIDVCNCRIPAYVWWTYELLEKFLLATGFGRHEKLSILHDSGIQRVLPFLPIYVLRLH